MKYFLTVFIFLNAVVPNFAQGLKVQVSKNKLSLGEYLEVKYTIDGGNDRNFKTGSFNNLKIAQGPNSSSNMQWINGKFSQSKTYSYVLLPQKEGILEIPQASVQIKGKLYKSSPIKIVVKKDALYDQQQKKAKQSQGKLEDFVYLKVEAPKDTIYKGEQLIVNYNLYTAYQVKNFNIVETPSFTGFWQRDLIDGNYPQRSTYISGKQFTIVGLKKLALFPQVTGNVELEPITVEGDVRVKVNNTNKRRKRSNDPFDQFLNDPIFSSPFGSYKNIHKKITSEPFNLVVLPLPKPVKSETFTGAVGRFTIGANLDKRQLKTDEAATLKITINGDGNLKLFDAPLVNFPDELEVFDVKVTENIYTNSGSVRGSKVFEYPIIPRKEGRYIIPKIDWSYFDIKTEKYKTYSVGPFTINVLKGDDYKDNESTYVESKSDIAPAKPEITITKQTKNYLIKSPIGLGFTLLPILMMPILFFIRRQRDINRPSEEEIKFNKANKVALKKLEKAKSYLKNEEGKLFYNEVIHSIWGYMNDKFELQNSEMNIENIYNKLVENNISEALASETKQLASNCEMSIFAPGAVQFNKKEIYTQALNLLSKLEDAQK